MISIFLLKIWNQYNKTPSLILYLDVSPEICYSRLQKQKRQGEEGVSLQYLIDLDIQYKKYLNEMSKSCEIVVLKNENTLILPDLYSSPNQIRDNALEAISDHVSNWNTENFPLKN